VLETFKLYSATQCDGDACLIIGLRLAWLCKMESPSNQKLFATYNLPDNVTEFVLPLLLSQL